MGQIDWQGGLTWATSLGQYGILVEFAVVGALWVMGALVEGLTAGRRKLESEIDAD